MNNKLDEYGEGNVRKYIVFYDSIPNNTLQKILSIVHYNINNLFEYLNSRIYNGHYTASESRELIYWIKELDNLQLRLRDTEFEIEINEYYTDLTSQCKKFLQNSGGSPIPDGFKQIIIVDFEPLFRLKSSIVIERNHKNMSFPIKLIGSGSYADVFRYKDEYYNRFFAIKRAKSDLRQDEYERFKREFEEMEKLNSPYVIEVYNYNEDKHEYIMEYADQTLKEYISQNNTKISNKERANIVRQVLKAFKYINDKGVLHRDISTKNVLIKKYDNILVIKVSDFGLVKLIDSNLTRAGTEIKGAFNDLKQLDIVGFENYNIEHETYALTRLIYFIMTGKTSLEGYHSTVFKEFVARGISDDVRNRYHTVDEIAIAFNNLIKVLEK